jgi:tRNA dimethylallyltransferase
VKKLPKIIVVCGPTATGKSDRAVSLALEQNVEIVSADSRQIYKGLNIGSGKITKKETREVAHHMLDIASPLRTYSVAQFQKKATAHIQDILKRGKIPIICGGTGFYIDALVHGTSFPEVKANTLLRKKLEKRNTTDLFTMLEKKDPRRAKEIDKHNKARIIRALEIITALGAVPKAVKKTSYNIEWIYLDFPDDVLRRRINARLLKRMKQGMVAEAKKLHTQGLSFARMERLGLEYRYLALLLQNKITKKEFLEQLENEIWHYAKRQRTWFKKYIPKN